jgi:hypothetical protein
MAWTGEVMRRIRAAKPRESGSILVFECGHEQDSVLSPYQTVIREWVCEQCSSKSMARVREIQESITFDSVLERIKDLCP